jgi:hypothetical protein
MMKQSILVDPNYAQSQVLADTVSKFLYMSGGYGSGKTYALVLKLFQLMNLNPKVPGGLLCPNMKMFKRDVLPTIRQIAGESDIQFRYARQEAELYFPATESTVYVYHATDDGESIAGSNLGWALVNEASLCSWMAIKALMGRMRLRRTKVPQMFMSGTPEEFNWVYEFFIEKPKEGRKIIYASSRDNPHTADWYVDMLDESYDEIARQQYVDGLFIPRAGNRFLHTFNRHKHVTDYAVRVIGAPVWVQVDFNVNPMVATIASYVPESKVKLRIFDEISMAGADTYSLCDMLKDKIGERWRGATIFPDPAGKARKTSAKDLISDIKIMQDAGFSDIRFKNQLSVKDCYFAANNLIDKGMVAVHPKCRELIADAEQVKVKDGAFEMDKANPRRTHALDGFKNMADYMFPVTKSYSEVSNKIIR